MKLVVNRRNGTAGALSFGDLSPEMRPIIIQRKNVIQNTEGQVTEILEDITLYGYVNSPRCPSTVRVALWSADAELSEVADDEGKPDDEKIYPNKIDFEIAKTNGYYRHFQLQLLAVIKGLEEEEADVLAGQSDRVHKILEYLGWETKVSSGSEDEATDDIPEVVQVQ